MNSTTYRFQNRPRLTIALVLAAGGVLGLLAACSSDGNPTPSHPVITTGGGGSGGAGESDAGETSVGGSRAGSGNNTAGGANGGSGGRPVVVEGGAGGEAGEAGAGPLAPTCPTTDLGFFNQPSSSQKSPFDNTKRLGAHTPLPPLP